MPRRFLLLPLILAALLVAVIVNAPRRAAPTVEAAEAPIARDTAAREIASQTITPRVPEEPSGPAPGPAAKTEDRPEIPSAEPALPPADEPADDPPAAEEPAEEPMPEAALLAGLELRVREPSGEAVPGARVRLRPAGSPWAEGQTAVADASGRAHFAGLAPGAFEARLTSDGFLLSPESFPLAEEGAHLEVSLGPGETRAFPLAAPARARTTLHLEFGGRALGGARIELVPRVGAGSHDPVRLEADESGRAVLPALPAGPWRLAVEHRWLPESLRVPIELSAGTRVLAPGWEPSEVAGNLRDGAGRPVVGAEVWVEGPWRARRQGRSGEWVLASWPEEGLQTEAVERGRLGGVLSDPRGFYLLSGILPGPGLELVVEAPGFAPLRRPLDLVPAASRRLDLELVPGAGLTLEVVDRNGRALAGAWLALSGDGGEPARLGVTDREGRARFPSLAPGTYRIQPVAGRGVDFATRDLNLAVGENARLVLSL